MKNKTILGIVAIMLLVMSSVMVVGADDILVECGGGRFNSNICRDYELQNEFDTMVDYLNAQEDYIAENEGKWSKDVVGGGIGSSRVYKILGISEDLVETNVFNYLATIFSNKAELEIANQRIDVLEAKLHLLITEQPITPKAVMLTSSMIKSDRISEEITFTWINDFYRCNADRCITIRGVN